MTYYKIIKNNEFIGIGTSYELRKYQQKHNILLVADDNTAQYIQVKDKLYRDDWFKLLNTNSIEYEIANISVISEDEYKQLLEAIDKGEEISIPIEADNIIEANDNVIVNEEEIITLEYLKTQKIKEMSHICNQTITNGFDITLSDGKEHHFSLTTQDQLNLITLSAMVSAGETTIPYHADGELCRYFSTDDIDAIIKTATVFKAYQTTYFNSLKIYIQALDNREAVSNIYYGVDIPKEYKPDVLIAMLAGSNDTEGERYETNQ